MLLIYSSLLIKEVQRRILTLSEVITQRCAIIESKPTQKVVLSANFK